MIDLQNKQQGDRVTSEKPMILTQVVEEIVEVPEGPTVSLREIVEAMGRVSFTPLLLVPAIALATPLSGIPLFSSIMGTLIFLVALQMLMRRDHIWLPNWLLDLSTKSKRVELAFSKIKPFVSWIDTYPNARFTILTRRPFVIFPQVLCLLSGLFLPFLEFVPFSSSLVGLAVALLALGMLARDGLILCLGVIPYVGIAWLISRVI